MTGKNLEQIDTDQNEAQKKSQLTRLVEKTTAPVINMSIDLIDSFTEGATESTN